MPEVSNSSPTSRSYLMVARDESFDGNRVSHIRLANNGEALGWAAERAEAFSIGMWTLFVYGPRGLVEINNERDVERRSVSS
ncbi:hypothetical protein BH09ACT10_BH09ACT10_23790 [soil metagenome]